LFSRIFYKSNKDFYIIINTPTFLYRCHANSITTKNSHYVFKNKESELHTLSLNLGRSLSLKDDELIQSMFRLHINLLKKAIVNNHTKNSRDIIYTIQQYFFKYNQIKIYTIKIFVLLDKYIFLSHLPWHYLVKKMKMKYN
jgi:hypothetical protein